MKSTRRKQGDRIGGQTRMAAEIHARFQIPCTRKTVQQWQLRWNPPFPSPDSGNFYSRSAGFDWVEKIYLPKMAANPGQVDLLIDASNARSRLEIAKAKRAELDLKIEEGKYIARDVAERTIAGAMKSYHAFVRRELENYQPAARREKLQQLGVSAEHIALFHAFDVQSAQLVIDKIEKQCAEMAK